MTKPEEKVEVTVHLPVELLHELNVYAQARRVKIDEIIQRLLVHYMNFVKTKVN